MTIVLARKTGPIKAGSSRHSLAPSSSEVVRFQFQLKLIRRRTNNHLRRAGRLCIRCAHSLAGVDIETRRPNERSRIEMEWMSAWKGRGDGDRDRARTTRADANADGRTSARRADPTISNLTSQICRLGERTGAGNWPWPGGAADGRTDADGRPGTGRDGHSFLIHLGRFSEWPSA